LSLREIKDLPSRLWHTSKSRFHADATIGNCRDLVQFARGFQHLRPKRETPSTGPGEPVESRSKEERMGPLDQPAKISWALLPEAFRRVWLELALDKCGAERCGSIGYVLVAPLAEDGSIDIDLWRQFHEFCGVVRFRPLESDDVGHLVRTSGGTWAFRYDVTGKPADEPAYHLGSERLVAGDYAFIHDDQGPHIFQVASVEPL
jgi:hypothetical protein